MNIHMWKVLKRAVQLSAALVIFGIGFFMVSENSEVFATDIAYLECTLDKVSPDDFDKIRNNYGLVAYARLQKDYIKDAVLLTWLDINGDSETGTDPTLLLNITTSAYFAKHSNVSRSFDRKTLRYKWVALDSDNELWFERSCVKTTRQKYEDERAKEIIRIKSNQNI